MESSESEMNTQTDILHLQNQRTIIKIVSVGFNTRFIRSDYVQPTHLNESFLPKSDANVGLPNLSMTQMVFYMTTMCSKCKTEVKNKNETLGSTNN